MVFNSKSGKVTARLDALKIDVIFFNTIVLRRRRASSSFLFWGEDGGGFVCRSVRLKQSVCRRIPREVFLYAVCYIFFGNFGSLVFFFFFPPFKTN